MGVQEPSHSLVTVLDAWIASGHRTHIHPDVARAARSGSTNEFLNALRKTERGDTGGSDPAASEGLAKFLGKNVDDKITDSDIDKIIELIFKDVPSIPIVTDQMKAVMRGYMDGWIGQEIGKVDWNPDLVRAFTSAWTGMSGDDEGQKTVDKATDVLQFLTDPAHWLWILVGIAGIGIVVFGARNLMDSLA